MTLQVLPYDYTICKIKELSQADLSKEIFFVGKTDEELSLVCRTEDVPADTVERVRRSCDQVSLMPTPVSF